MVTTAPARPASLPTARASRLAFTWRFSEAFWPILPSASGLDAEAVCLVRSRLTLAVEQMLERRRAIGAPLPPRCDLAIVCQQRFDPLLIYWETRRDELQALLAAAAQMMLALARRPLGGQDGGRWASALAQQCERIGCLYQALARRGGRASALIDLRQALEAASRSRC